MYPLLRNSHSPLRSFMMIIRNMRRCSENEKNVIIIRVFSAREWIRSQLTITNVHCPFQANFHPKPTNTLELEDCSCNYCRQCV